MLGRAAILHHNFPILYEENDEFTPSQIPVSVDYLTKEGLSPKFIEYMSNWGFVDGSVDLMKEAIKKLNLKSYRLSLALNRIWVGT